MTRIRTRYLFTHAAVLGAVGLLSYFAAFHLRLAGDFDAPEWGAYGKTALTAAMIRLAALLWLGHRHAWCVYSSFHDLLTIVRGVTVGTLVLTLADALLFTSVTIPRGVLFLDWGIATLSLAAISSIPRVIHDVGRKSFASQGRIAALIVGADDAGEGLLRAIRRSPNLNYRPIGFIDDRRDPVGRRVAGLPVLGSLDQLAEVARRYNVQQVLLTSGRLPGLQVREIIKHAAEEDLDVRVLPSFEQLLAEDVEVKPREVAISDLLRRAPIELDSNQIREWVRGRTVMVTGSAGSIGSEIAEQILRLRPRRIVLVDRSETGQFFLERKLASHPDASDYHVVLADLTDAERLDAVFREYRPDLIFHAGAYKHVPLMEENPGEAIKNIVVATRNVVDLAEEYDAEGVVMISTDKAVNPTSVMGSCKRIAERYVQAKAVASTCRLVTVRFGNVLDSAGSVVPIFRQQIASGGPVTVTHPDMIRYFMLIPEAAQLVIQAGAMGRGGEIFVLDMGEPVRLLDLARDMIRLSGLREGDDVEIKITGVRPGEKLYEELYGPAEKHTPTRNAKIMVAASTPLPLVQVISDIGRLVEAANDPADEVRDLLNEIVPRMRAASTTRDAQAA